MFEIIFEFFNEERRIQNATFLQMAPRYKQNLTLGGKPRFLTVTACTQAPVIANCGRPGHVTEDVDTCLCNLTLHETV